MDLIKKAIEYCKNNLWQTVILAAIVLLIILTVILLAISARRNKAKGKKSVEKAQPTAPTAKPEPVTTMVKAEPAPVEKKASPTTKKAEPAVIVEESSEQTATTEASKQQPKKQTKSTAKTDNAPVQEAKAEPVVVEEAKSQPKQTTKKTTEEKKASANSEKKTNTKTNTEKTTKKSGGETMLLDELKDSLNGIDFYEEDELDRVARYSGKWVICRVVTEDKAEEGDEMYFFELHASNGEKLLSSEEYTSYNGALRGIETHKANILRNNFKITLSKKGDYIFKLLSGKNMLLCMGENYPTKARCESAIESAKRFAKTAIVDENLQDHIVKLPVEDDTPLAPLPENCNGKWIITGVKGEDGEHVYYFELFANNGEKLLSSEEYTTYIGAVNGIQTHKSNIAKDNFRISLTKRGDYIYKLLNGNGQLLCLGEHYKTKRRCLNAVESVKRFAANSPVLTDPEHTR